MTSSLILNNEPLDLSFIQFAHHLFVLLYYCINRALLVCLHLGVHLYLEAAHLIHVFTLFHSSHSRLLQHVILCPLFTFYSEARKFCKFYFDKNLKIWCSQLPFVRCAAVSDATHVSETWIEGCYIRHCCRMSAIVPLLFLFTPRFLFLVSFVICICFLWIRTCIHPRFVFSSLLCVCISCEVCNCCFFCNSSCS